MTNLSLIGPGRWSLTGPGVYNTGHLQAGTGFVCSSPFHRGTTLLSPGIPDFPMSTACSAHIQTISSPLEKRPD